MDLEIVKRKDTGMYLHYIYSLENVHEESMRHHT